jgi:hypothetical protein
VTVDQSAPCGLERRTAYCQAAAAVTSALPSPRLTGHMAGQYQNAQNWMDVQRRLGRPEGHRLDQRKPLFGHSRSGLGGEPASL